MKDRIRGHTGNTTLEFNVDRETFQSVGSRFRLGILIGKAHRTSQLPTSKKHKSGFYYMNFGTLFLVRCVGWNGGGS
jgi:hypothetical protein